MNPLNFPPGPVQRAATLIQRETSLGSTPAVKWETQGDMLTLYPSAYVLSSGEQVLYDLLASIAYGSSFSLYTLRALDEQTRLAAVTAIGVGVGLEVGELTS